MDSLQGLSTDIEGSRREGTDSSAEISDRFFNQSGNRSPPSAAAALDAASPRMPPGIQRVSLGTVRSAADIDRLLPDPRRSHNPYVQKYLEELIGGLKSGLSEMTPYRIYTYYDSRGGRLVGIDLAANPAIADKIPGLEPHEITLIKKLSRVDPDIRVLVREDGKTPDLVIGERIVEMKTFLGEHMTLAEIIDKANGQVYEHGRAHGLGNGAAAVDLAKESQVPVSLIRQTLNSWQSGSDRVALDQVIFFAGDEMKVFQRQADGTYEPADRASLSAAPAQDRPLAPGERGLAQSLLRQSKPLGAGIAPAISDPKRAEAILGLISDIQAGRPLGRRQDGEVWGNREGVLPAQPQGYYREYTFIPPRGSLAAFKMGEKLCQPDHNGGPRGAERIIIGGGREIYYTSDHYRSFTRLTVLP
jgi:guanyl-specific ribonuclease Sa